MIKHAFLIVNFYLHLNLISGWAFPQPSFPSNSRNCRGCMQHPSRRQKRSHLTLSQRKSLVPEDLPSPAKDRMAGLAVLATVPLAWGTYGPVVKYIYDVTPPVPGIVFSAAYYAVASLVLHSWSWWLEYKSQNGSDMSKNNDISEYERQSKWSTSYQGGIELGSYLFLANLLQIKGLETVPSDRAGFLVQLTTLMVPLFSAYQNPIGVTPRTWTACLLAFGGVLVMEFDGSNIENLIVSSSVPSVNGDAWIIAAAVLYSLHVIRLGQYAPSTTPLSLATAKATVEAFLGILTIAASLIIGKRDENDVDVATYSSSLVAGLTSGTVSMSHDFLPVLGAILWTGCITCAYTIYAQSYGQARVPATDANLVYTIQPLFTAVFAYILLGETLGPQSTIGASLIASAVYIVATSKIDENVKKTP
jgi:drug/metabolite transporter (DMT)-like permease